MDMRGVSARALRVFVLESAQVPARPIIELIMLPREEAAARLVSGGALLRGGT